MLPHKMIDWTVLKWRAADQPKQFSPKNPTQLNAQFERNGPACILVATGTYLKEKLMHSGKLYMRIVCICTCITDQ